MGLDIKFPIGLMFTLLGLLLTFYGIGTNGNAALYEKSLNINVNLWSGVFMLVFGGLMIAFSRISRKRNLKKESS